MSKNVFKIDQSLCDHQGILSHHLLTLIANVRFGVISKETDLGNTL